MRVAFVNATHRWGGVKTWTLGLARGLAARGHEVNLFLRAGDPFAGACRGAGLGVRELAFGPDWNPLAVRSLRKEFRERRSEIVITNVSKDNRVGGPAARGAGIPVVQHVGGPGDITDRFRVRLEHRRYVTRVIVPARFVQRMLAELPWMRAEERVHVIHNAVDVDRFRPGRGAGKLRGELEAGPGTPLVVTTGQLTGIKGHRHLLDALAVLGERRPAPMLVLVGTGPEEAPLRRRAAALGIAGRVRFLGFRRDLEDLLEDADIVVQPSLMEGFPLSVVEFMAKAKAIVATRLEGMAEAIDHGRHGILVPPGDPAALAAAMTRLLEDPGLRESLGREARNRAIAEFGLDTMVERVERLLRSTVDAGVPA